VLDWPAGGRIRVARPAPGSPAAEWLGSRPGRLGHLVFELDDPAAVPGAQPAADGSYEVPASDNLGVRLVVRPRA
jgi:hypothetical protein